MARLVPFDFRAHHVELTADFSPGPTPAVIIIRFFVTVVDEQGGSLGIWDGADYSAAIFEAEKARVDFEVSEIMDLVAGDPLQ